MLEHFRRTTLRCFERFLLGEIGPEELRAVADDCKVSSVVELCDVLSFLGDGCWGVRVECSHVAATTRVAFLDGRLDHDGLTSWLRAASGDPCRAALQDIAPLLASAGEHSAYRGDRPGDLSDARRRFGHRQRPPCRGACLLVASGGAPRSQGGRLPADGFSRTCSDTLALSACAFWRTRWRAPRRGRASGSISACCGARDRGRSPANSRANDSVGAVGGGGGPGPPHPVFALHAASSSGRSCRASWPS